MNKKKLPKVIVCLGDEIHPATSPSAIAKGQQPPPAEFSDLRKVALSELPQPANNVVQMTRSADFSSPNRDSKTAGSPHVTLEREHRRSKAQAIVDRYAALSAVGGLIPLAFANFAGIATIIVRLVKVLCKHYGVPFEHDRTRAIVIGLVGGAMPTGVAAITTSTLLYVAPPAAIFGLAVSGVTAAVFTRSVGRIFIEHFESGAPLDGISAPQG
jgi:uncharacterized protein (DUF697 family)